MFYTAKGYISFIDKFRQIFNYIFLLIIQLTLMILMVLNKIYTL